MDEKCHWDHCVQRVRDREEGSRCKVIIYGILRPISRHTAGPTHPPHLRQGPHAADLLVGICVAPSLHLHQHLGWGEGYEGGWLCMLLYPGYVLILFEIRVYDQKCDSTLLMCKQFAAREEPNTGCPSPPSLPLMQVRRACMSCAPLSLLWGRASACCPLGKLRWPPAYHPSGGGVK